jgi:uncharacterized membrane protein YfcA
MLWWYYPLLFFTGIVVGFINTIAGSGSFLTLPILIFTGMPAPVANGTNRISILLQTLTGLLSFRKQKMLDLKNAALLACFTIPGAIAGSFVVVDIPDGILQNIIGYVMLLFAVLTIWKPNAFKRKTEIETQIKLKWFHFAIFVVIGFYGGFIQAGVGIFILFALVLTAGYDLIRANAIKLALTFVFTPFSLVVFIHNKQVDWIPGLVLAAGSIAGAVCGARFAIKRGTNAVRIVLFIVLALSSLKMIFN